MFQPRPQVFSSAVYPRLDGLGRALENRSNIGVREFLVFRENEWSAEVFGQFSDGCANSLRTFGCLLGFARRWFVLRQVLLEVEFDSANIDKFTAGSVPELNEDFVHCSLQLAFRVNEIHREVVYLLRRKRSAGGRSPPPSTTELLPREESPHANRHGEKQHDKTPVGIKVAGSDLAELERVASEIEAVVRQVPNTTSVFAERVMGGNYIEFKIDREQIARYGLRVGDVQEPIALSQELQTKSRHSNPTGTEAELRVTTDACRSSKQNVVMNTETQSGTMANVAFLD